MRDTSEDVQRHIEALLRFADILPKQPRPRTAKERQRRVQRQSVELPAWQRKVLGPLRTEPTERSWEARADALQRLYLIAWGDTWVKYGHGTDARVREHLANPPTPRAPGR